MTLLLWYSPHFCTQESLKPFLETLNTTLQRQNVSERLLKENENNMSIKISKITDFVETLILALRATLKRELEESASHHVFSFALLRAELLYRASRTQRSSQISKKMWKI